MASSTNPMDLIDDDELLVPKKDQKPFSIIFGSNSSPIKNSALQIGVGKEDLDSHYQQIDKNIKELKNTLPGNFFKRMYKVFKIMIANAEPGKIETLAPWQYFCTEKSITENFHKVFGYKCDVMAKILYFNMSNMKVHAKIDFTQFVAIFEDLNDEVQKLRNKVIFNMLDVKKQGKLDVMVLI
jgi:hypothetical protein